MDDHGPPSEDEVIKFREKPNAFLYSLEATRAWILFMLCFNVVQVLLLHFAKGAPIAFMVKLTLLIDCVLFAIFVVAVMLRALGITFIATNKNVIVRFTPFGGAAREVSIPIEDIKSIEVRCYGTRYGSVNLERYKDLYEALPRRPVNLKERQGWGSIWFSLPWGWPPLIGFYGFKNYGAFARLIVDLRAAGV
jgi:hypothetical protein